MSLRGRSEAIHLFGNVAGAGPTTILAGVAGQIIRVYRLIIVNGAAGQTITLQDTASGGTAVSEGFLLLANGTVTLDTPINGDPWFFSGDRGNAATVLGLGLQWSNTAAFGYDIWVLQGP